MKIYTILIIIVVLNCYDGFSQIKSEGERVQIEDVFQAVSTATLLELVTSSDTSITISRLQRLLEFKIPVYHPILKSQRITSVFGNRLHPMFRKIRFHNGLDIAACFNQSVFATADGEVISVGYESGLGNFVKIKHSLGFETVYGHLNAVNVDVSNRVYQGQIIGFCGSTGNSTGVHLHYSVLRFKRFINPLGLL